MIGHLDYPSINISCQSFAAARLDTSSVASMLVCREGGSSNDLATRRGTSKLHFDSHRLQSDVRVLRDIGMTLALLFESALMT